MSQLLYGQICVSDLPQAKMKQGKNGKWYLDINVWINDQLDQYGNIAGISVGQTKEEREAKTKRIYIGNLKSPNAAAAPATYPGAPTGYPTAPQGAQQAASAGYAPPTAGAGYAPPTAGAGYAPPTAGAGYAPPAAGQPTVGYTPPASGYTPPAAGGKPPF